MESYRLRERERFTRCLASIRVSALSNPSRTSVAGRPNRHQEFRFAIWAEAAVTTCATRFRISRTLSCICANLLANKNLATQHSNEVTGPGSELPIGLSFWNCPIFSVWALAWHGSNVVVLRERSQANCP